MLKPCLYSCFYFLTGYTVSDTVMGCSVSAYDTRDVGEFVKCLESAFDDMFSVLDNKEFRK